MCRDGFHPTLKHFYYYLCGVIRVDVITYYIIRKIKGNYYLIKIEYDSGTGRKHQKSLGNVKEIEKIIEWYRKWYAPKNKAREGGAGGGIRTHAGLRHRGLSPYYASSGTREFQPNGGGTPEAERAKTVERFIKWCVDSGTSRETCEQYGRYLMRPYDPNNKWSRLAYKKYFKWIGNEEEWKKIKVKGSTPDLRIPTEEEVRETIKAACEASEELCLIYKLLLESGARLAEVVKALNDFNPKNLKHHDGFCTYALGYFRGSKQSFYLFTVTPPRRLKCSANWVSNWAAKNGHIAPKYIRKFVATKMLSLGIPSEVVNFIQGRVPRTILERNYLGLYVLAIKYYPRYTEWLREATKK